MRITLMVLLGAAILALPACNEQKLNRLDSESLASDLNAKINLDTAAYEQVSEYVYECQGGKLCVPICHRPPGHPMNAKTKELPLQASRAHLGHGDYLGACAPEDETPTDPDDPRDDDVVEPGDPVDETDIPEWCIPFYEVDRDCDGFYDEDGQPIF